MSQDNLRLAELFDKYVAKTCTPEEFRELLGYFGDPGWTPALEQLADIEYDRITLLDDREVDWERMFREIIQPEAEVPVRTVPFLRRSWLRYAAAIILTAGIGLYWYFSSSLPGKQQDVVQNVIVPEIVPGGNKAILTLAGGRQIVLDSVRNGTLAHEGGATIVKSANGQIRYETPATATGTITMNTMRTPRGGQYQLTLPDGTRVWLNAASSITYPTAFKGKERAVSVDGEVYFEVSKNPAMPFIVTEPNTDVRIQVLGTHFNVNTYRDEPSIDITLLEGSVQVSMAGQRLVLQSGEQAQATSTLHVNKNVDTAAVTAWLHGRFDFSNGADLSVIMRQISRWYDVDIEYQEPVREQFWGSVSRQSTVKQMLDKLTLTRRVRFEIQGKKIIVIPYRKP